MTRRFAWLLGVSLAASHVASPAFGQETLPAPMPAVGETPAPKAVAPAPEPVAMTQPVSDVFFPIATPRPQITFSAQVLQWWYKRDAIPSLLNTGNETSAGIERIGPRPFGAAPGTQNDPNHVEVFGSNQYSYGTVPGIRLDFGIAIVDNLDLELNGFLTETQTLNQTFAGVNGSPFLTRPFYNSHDLIESGYDTSSAFGSFNTGTQTYNTPGISGDMNFDASTQFYGFEANLAWYVTPKDTKLQKLIFGYRQMTLNEHLIITENVLANQTGVLAFFPTGTGAGREYNYTPGVDTIRIVDGFTTRNTFYGPQFGAQWEFGWGPLTFDFLAKFAVGLSRESINVYGVTQRINGSGTVIGQGAGGLLAVSTNSGSRTLNELAVVPEIGLKLNYDVTDHIRVHAGYNMLYISSVARPGTQIDRRINPELVPHDAAYNPATSGPLTPRAQFRDTDFFANGVSFGLEVRY